MNKTNKIIALTLALLLSFPPAKVSAQETNLSPVEQACETFKANFYEEGKMTEAWEFPSPLDSKVFEEQFEKAQDSYHNYIACLFDYAESTIYGSEGSYHGGTVQANTANTNIIDWMAPNEACISSTELNKVFNSTSPTEMLGPLLQTHADYKKYLTALIQEYSDKGVEVNAAGVETGGSEQLIAKVTFLNEADRKIQVELDSAMVAMDMMLHSLKELRTSFVLHVHFQCTIKYLDQYRKALEKLRNLIQPLPDQLRDASVVK